MSAVLSSAVLSVAPAQPETAAAHYAARLAFEADVSDVHADLHANVAGLVVVDSRSPEAWLQGHLPGAVHLPTALIAERAPALVPRDSVVVTYCWGPGCNGATRAALAFARLGYRVKEMIGGYEYWVREGFAVRTGDGTVTRPADPLTTIDPGRRAEPDAPSQTDPTIDPGPRAEPDAPGLGWDCGC